MAFESIIFEKSESVAIIKFNRPQTFNAFNMSIGTELIEALESCSYDDDVRAVILTAEGKAFCSGGDISVFKDSIATPDPSKPIRDLIVPFNKCIYLIRRMPKPVLCAVNGVAGGAGMSFVAACDYRMAASSAKFKQAYTSMGLTGDGAWMLLVPMLIGFARATEMVLFDQLVDAQKALEWGLVNQVVEDGRLEEESMRTAVELSRKATKALGMAKGNLNHAMAGMLESQLLFEGDGMIKASMHTKDYREAVKSFLEKRKPEFMGC